MITLTTIAIVSAVSIYALRKQNLTSIGGLFQHIVMFILFTSVAMIITGFKLTIRIVD